MHGVHVKLNPKLQWLKQDSKEEESFHQQTGLKFKEETSKVLHFEYCYLWCWNVATSENR
jgi:hypothetical protein